MKDEIRRHFVKVLAWYPPENTRSNPKETPASKGKKILSNNNPIARITISFINPLIRISIPYEIDCTPYCGFKFLAQIHFPKKEEKFVINVIKSPTFSLLPLYYTILQKKTVVSQFNYKNDGIIYTALSIKWNFQ